MKYKTTQKAIKAHYNHILKAGYCDLQYLLTYETPEAYTANNYGWRSDIYCFSNFAISTGYTPFGNILVDCYTCQKYEKLAQEILHNDFNYESAKGKLRELLQKLYKEVSGW